MDKINIIFLDIDGVLNTIRCFEKYGEKYINNKLIENLCNAVNETNAKLVLSSNWRLYHSDKRIIKSALNQFDLSLYSETKYLKDKSNEIELWLSENNVDKFVVIDDDSRIKTKRKNGLIIKVNEDVGLTTLNVKEIKQFFNKN